MRHLIQLTAVALASAAVLASGPAPAAAPTPFTITETVDFSGTTDNTFTATGPLCASGTFTDDVHTVAPGGGSAQGPDHSGGLNLQIHTVYTCGDGSGFFEATKNIRLTFTEDGTTSSGPILLRGGSAAYRGLSGHGTDIGVSSGDSGAGTITGVIVRR